jgi:hypothetical protein
MIFNERLRLSLGFEGTSFNAEAEEDFYDYDEELDGADFDPKNYPVGPERKW